MITTYIKNSQRAISAEFNGITITIEQGRAQSTQPRWTIDLPGSLVRLTGDKQEGAPGAALAHPFVVYVRDQRGRPLEGAEVTFAVTAGGGTLSATTANTDANGRAATTLTLGSLPGANTIEATVEGLDPVTFTATAEATPDFDGDGETGFSDFFLFADAFGGSDPRFDLDGSGSVDFADFFILADYFADPARGKLLALARELIGLPDGPQLRQNAPNPFNSETVISWFLLRPGAARVEVFALTGQRGGGASPGAREGRSPPRALGRPGTTGAAPWPAGCTCTGWLRTRASRPASSPCCGEVRGDWFPRPPP